MSILTLPGYWNDTIRLSPPQKYYNIFLFVAILITIDNLLIRVYKKYQKVLSEF